jgi:epoxyqueuosine reductase QueG
MRDVRTTEGSDTAAWIAARIVELCHAARRELFPGEADTAAAGPLVGFAKGDDPLFTDFKQHVGASHWTPLEAFGLAFPTLPAAAAELTVISWILPHPAQVKADNRRERRLPAESWALGKLRGEQVNNVLREQTVKLLAETDVAAVAPAGMAQWTAGELTSVWSERHVAFAAGSGTFGLCDGLITPVGKAMRCGSVVARLALPATPRAYSDHHAYCLWYAEKKCGACMARCPADAISAFGHDKARCLAYLKTVRREYLEPQLSLSTYACGLCQTRVPCESRIPHHGRR